MQKCSSRHCGPCSFCPSSSSLSMFLSSPSICRNDDDVFPPAVVDCTLSLATPSSTPPRRTSHFCRDIFPPPPTPTAASALVHKYHHTIIPRQCANCHTISTPLWRNGPRGPKSLCNACGIRYRKEERRAYAAAAAAAAVNGGSNGSGVATGSETAQRVMNTSWALPHYTQARKKGCFSTSAAYGGRNELRFMDVGGGDHRRRDSDVISWRHLSNVVFFPANRSPTIVHDFITRS